MNIYQSVYYNSQYFSHLVVQPSLENIKGMTNQAIHLISKESITSIPQKLDNMNTKRIAIVSILCVITIAIILLSRCIFRANSSSSHPSDTDDAPKVDNAKANTDDVVKVDDAKADTDNAVKVGYAKDKGIYNKSKELADKGELQEAWSSYCYESYFDVNNMYPDNKEPYDNHTCSLNEWIELPSEKLISGFLNVSANNQISERVPRELLRDCAIAYPDFFKNYLLRICIRLETYPTDIIDICKTSPVYGVKIVLDGIDNYISPYYFDHKLFFELYQTIHPSLLKHIANKALTDDEKSNLNYFLGMTY